MRRSTKTETVADIAHTMHPFAPVLRQLEESLWRPAASYLHWGATTQNIVDTGMALQLQRSHVLLMDFVDGLWLRWRRLRVSIATRRRPAGRMVNTRRPLLSASRSRLGTARRGDIANGFSSPHAARLGPAWGVPSERLQRWQAKVESSRIGCRAPRSRDEIADVQRLRRQAVHISAVGLMGSTIEKVAGGNLYASTDGDAESLGFPSRQSRQLDHGDKRNPGLAMNLTGLSRFLRSRIPRPGSNGAT